MLDKTFTAIGRREDLADQPFDAAESQRLAERFLTDPAAAAPSAPAA